MNRYDNNPSKDVAMAKVRHRRMEEMHNEANAFVRKEQDAMKNMGGRAPALKEAAMNFNAYMCNDGMHAQELAREATKDLDKKAFPVR